jgi:hypothetical protein
MKNLAEFVKNRFAPAEHEPDPLLVAEEGERLETHGYLHGLFIGENPVALD